MVQEGVDGRNRHLIHPRVVNLEVVARRRSHGRAVAVVLLHGLLWRLVCGVLRLVCRLSGLLVGRLLVGRLLVCRLLVSGLLLHRLLVRRLLLHRLLLHRLRRLLHGLLLRGRGVGLWINERKILSPSSSQWGFRSHDCTVSALQYW